MIFRRLARPIIVLLALWCLWEIFNSDLKLLIPGIKEDFIAISSGISVEPVLELPKIPEIPTKPSSRVAKITVAANSLNSSIIHQALQTHKVQNDIHGYTHFIATNDLVDDMSEEDRQKRPRGAWSKPAYILSIIVTELAKSENERLKWVFWFDADTVVMNPHIALETFLPPDDSMPEISNVDLLIASNWDGLNTGAFALRICPWSVSFLSLVLAYPVYFSHKQKTDRFRDQSAFQWLLQSQESPLAKNGKGQTGRNHWDHWAVIPMRWINSFPINNAFSKKQDWIFNHEMTEELFDNGTDVVYNDGWGQLVKPWKVMQGDMIVHFAGATPVRDSWMGPWLKRAEAGLPEWSNATKQLDFEVEAFNFWNITSNSMASEREKERKKSRASQTAVKGLAANSLLQPTSVKISKTHTP